LRLIYLTWHRNRIGVSQFAFVSCRNMLDQRVDWLLQQVDHGTNMSIHLSFNPLTGTQKVTVKLFPEGHVDLPRPLLSAALASLKHGMQSHHVTDHGHKPAGTGISEVIFYCKRRAGPDTGNRRQEERGRHTAEASHSDAAKDGSPEHQQQHPQPPQQQLHQPPPQPQTEPTPSQEVEVIMESPFPKKKKKAKNATLSPEVEVVAVSGSPPHKVAKTCGTSASGAEGHGRSASGAEGPVGPMAPTAQVPAEVLTPAQAQAERIRAEMNTVHSLMQAIESQACDSPTLCSGHDGAVLLTRARELAAKYGTLKAQLDSLTVLGDCG
jgi:hypothetical protein